LKNNSLKTKSLFFDSALIICLIILFSNGCRVDDPIIDISGSGYPAEVGKIMLAKCATSGCHNEQSKQAAAGLSLVSWDALFLGGRNGGCIIPFRPDYSLCMYYVNTFPDLGPSLLPHMPYGQTALTRNEVLTLQNWIKQGAPNNKGEVKFSDNPKRAKIYVTNQGCDEVVVMDAETKLAMRFIWFASHPMEIIGMLYL
jgi:YVTN family beta-propeller protein